MANAILAAILSFIIPGLGQAYAGDIKKGVIFFVIALVIGITPGIIGTTMPASRILYKKL